MSQSIYQLDKQKAIRLLRIKIAGCNNTLEELYADRITLDNICKINLLKIKRSNLQRKLTNIRTGKPLNGYGDETIRFEGASYVLRADGS